MCCPICGHSTEHADAAEVVKCEKCLRSFQLEPEGNQNPIKSATIDINKACIRRYLTSQRRGDAFSADDHEAALFILRRVGFACAEHVFPDHQRTPGICVVCGCTELDPCDKSEPCSWEEGFNTICSDCAEA